MVCRTRAGGSASTSYAQQLTGLQTNEVLSLSHELRHEGASLPAPSAEQVSEWVDRTSQQVAQDPGLSDARRASIQRRLEQVRTSPPPGGPEFHAWTHITDRASTAREAIDGHLRHVAQRLGTTQGDVRSRFDSLYRQGDQRANGLSAPAEWAERFRGDADNGLIPADRGTMYALSELNTEADAARPAVARPLRQPLNSGFIRSAGYDRASGRLDVEIVHGDDATVYSYDNVPQPVVDEMTRPGGSAGRVYNQRVRGIYGQSDRFAAGGPQDRQQCPNCGQFVAGTGHTCPNQDAVAAPPGVTPVTGPAGAPAEPTRQEPAPTTPDGQPVNQPPQAPAEPETAPEDQRPRLVMAPTRRVEGSNFAMVVPGRREVRDFASQHPSFDMPVQSQPDDGSALVEGVVRVDTTPGGYLAVNREGLRCSCGRFSEDGVCGHVTGTADGVEASINGRRGGAAVANVEMVHDRVAAQLEAEEAARRAAATPEPPSVVSYAENMDAFRGAYEAATLRQRNGEPPVPFRPTVGLAAGTDEGDLGRSFGVEIEFAFPETMSWSEQNEARAQIGRELHALGLTNGPQQLGYHGTARQRAAGIWHRWGYESDGTVNGGEIVSGAGPRGGTGFLHDTEEDWEEVRAVCDIVRRNGGVANATTGCHVHIGVGDYGRDPDAHNRLLGDFRTNEDTLYRLAQRPGATRHRMSSNPYCRPANIPPDGYRSVDQIRASHMGHDRGLNFGAVSGRPSDHVEFRLWDGSLDPGVIQAQVAVSSGMAEAARNDAPNPAQSGPVGTHVNARNGSRRRLVGQEWENDTSAFRQFADRVLHNNETKAQVAALYAVNRWQRAPARRY